LKINNDYTYAIKLSYNNDAEGWRIPVLPESIEITEAGTGKTYDIIGKGGSIEETRAGEINVIKNPKLREVSFKSFFPANFHPYVSVLEKDLKQPFEYIADIRRWMATKHPIRFRFAGSKLKYISKTKAELRESDIDINMPASIEKFEWREVAGSPGDIEYSLSLKEYVFYSARRVTVAKNAAGETTLYQDPPMRPDERIRPETYTLRPGDNMWMVAQRILGDGARFREIMKLNNISDADAKRLQPGRVIQIPQN